MSLVRAWCRAFAEMQARRFAAGDPGDAMETFGARSAQASFRLRGRRLYGVSRPLIGRTQSVMVKLVLLLLGVDYLRERFRVIFGIGVLWIAAGLVIFTDAVDNALYFPITFFAWLFLAEGLATLAVAWTGMGGQRMLRYIKGWAVVGASALIFAGHHHGNMILSIIFGSLFLVDGLLQCVSAWTVRYRRWKTAFTWGTVEVIIAVFFYQPYPTHYVGTLPYCLGLFLIFGGLNMLSLAGRVRRLDGNPALSGSQRPGLHPDLDVARDVQPFGRKEWDGPPTDNECALTVHVWTPTGSSKSPARHHRS